MAEYATLITIRLGVDGSCTVVDDGRGFDPDRRRTGYGLDGMADRVALAGGTLTIDTTPDRGTVLTVALPIATPPLAGLPEEQNA